MRGLIFVMIFWAFTPLSKFQFDTIFHWILDATCSLHLLVLGVADMLHLDSFTPESLSSLRPLYTFFLDLSKFFFIILCQNVFLIQICDFTDAILLHLSMPWLLLFGFHILFWCGVKLLLLVFDKGHELVNCINWVVFFFGIVLTAGAIHVLMLLADEVFDNSLNLWRKIPLCTIPLKRFDVLRERFPVDLLSILHGRLLSDLLLAFLCLFHFDQLFLVGSQLVFKNFVNNLKL